MTVDVLESDCAPDDSRSAVQPSVWVAPIGRLLMFKGASATTREVLEALAGDLRPSAVVRLLAARSIPARLVEVDLDHLDRLSLPTLVFSKDGEPELLSEVRRGKIALDGGREEGVRWIARRDFAARFGGMALDLEGDASTEPFGARSSSFVAGVVRVLATQPRMLMRFALLTVAVQAARLAAPLITQVAVDRALPNRATSMVHVLAIAVVIASIHWAWLEWLRQSVVRSLDARLLASLLRAVFARILALPVPYLQRRNVGELLQCMASTESITGMPAQVAIPLFDAVAAVSYIAVIAMYLPGLATYVVLITLGLACVSAWCCVQFGTLQEGVLHASARHRAYLYEILEGAMTIKVASAQVRSVATWLGLLAGYQTDLVRQLRVALRLELTAQASGQLVTLSVLVWGGERCLRGEISVGVFLSTLLLAQAFTFSIMTLSMSPLPIWGARTDFHRVKELLDVEPATATRARAVRSGEIVLDDVWFRYSPSDPWILEGYSLRVSPSEHTTIRWPSGGGKTTLLRLIAGFYVPERGRVTVGGVPAHAATAESIAYLPQQVYLVEGSIMDNLRLMSQAPEERILLAAKMTGLAKLVDGLPMKYETSLTAGGRSLSGGQRQLIAFTACVASDQPVVLLDEAFANMDRLTRKGLIDSRLFEGRTVISVEHEIASPAERIADRSCEEPGEAR